MIKNLNMTSQLTSTDVYNR